MSYRCGAPNKSRDRPGTAVAKVRSSPCWQHGGGAAYSSPSTWWTSTAPAAFIADVVTQGLHPAVAGELADRVTHCLGTEGKRQLRRRRRKGVDCELLAEAARAILRLKRRAHKAVGEAVAEMFERLVRELPRFQRLLVRTLAEKLPLPWDVKVEAIVRGIQVVGIWICVVQVLPLEGCPCLQMMGGAELRERIEQEIQELLDATRQDIRTSRLVLQP